MPHLTDFGKNGEVNPRTGFPATPLTFSYSGQWNDHYYDTFHIRNGIGSEYCVDSELYYFKPRVLGKQNIARLEQKYFDCKKKYENERSLLTQSLGFRWSEPDPIYWTVKNIDKKWTKIELNKEQIQIAQMIRSYRNRYSILYLCMQFALETDFVSKHGYDIDKKNRENDFSSEEKRIVYTINGRKYSFLSSLNWRNGWEVEFKEINFQVIEETI